MRARSGQGSGWNAQLMLQSVVVYVLPLQIVSKRVSASDVTLLPGPLARQTVLYHTYLRARRVARTEVIGRAKRWCGALLTRTLVRCIAVAQ